MISLIIVDYKTIPKTLQYIHNCYQTITDSAYMHTVIVDNSEDASIGMRLLEAEGKAPLYRISVSSEGIDEMTEVYGGIFEERPILYVCAKQNLGYAKGNNLGAAIAGQYYKDDYYLFSNNDLRFPQKFALETLFGAMKKNQSIAVVGPKIVDINGEQETPRKKSNAWRQLFLEYFDMLLPPRVKLTSKITNVEKADQNQKCYWVTGSFLLVNAEKFEEVGKFDEETFLYCEEMILAERLQRCGYHMYYVNDIKIIHEHGQTVKSTYSALKGIQISFQSMLYYYRNYRKLNIVVIRCAQINFALFSFFFSIKKRIGKLIKR